MQQMLPILAAIVVASSLCGSAAAQRVPGSPENAPRVAYSRIFCTPDTETHFETVQVAVRRVDGAPPAPPLWVGGAQTATRSTFVSFEPGWGAQDREPHPAPFTQFTVMVAGSFAITTTDGETRHFSAGDVIRVEDTAPCKGHVTVAGDAPVVVMLIR
jgi:hypothetical protein